METLQEPTHFIIFLLPLIGLFNLVSLILIPILGSRNLGIWWKWLLLTLGIGGFAWIPLIVFLNQRKKEKVQGLSPK
jgi:hypothetical protein